MDFCFHQISSFLDKKIEAQTGQWNLSPSQLTRFQGGWNAVRIHVLNPHMLFSIGNENNLPSVSMTECTGKLQFSLFTSVFITSGKKRLVLGVISNFWLTHLYERNSLSYVINCDISPLRKRFISEIGQMAQWLRTLSLRTWIEFPAHT